MCILYSNSISIIIFISVVDIVNINIPKSGPSFPSPYPTSSPPFPPLSLSPHFFLLLFLQCLLLLLLSFLLFLILILLHLNLPFHLQLLLHLKLNYWYCEPQWTDVRCFFISELVLVPISVSIALFLFLFIPFSFSNYFLSSIYRISHFHCFPYMTISHGLPSPRLQSQ